VEQGVPAWAVVAFAAFVMGLGLLVSQVGGWATLARAYPSPRPFTGPRWRGQSAGMRWGVTYNGSLTVGADPQGLHLSILFVFRVGHPPLFVPWGDVTAVHEKSRRMPFSILRVGYVELRFRRAPAVPLRIREALAWRLAGAAGPAWPGPRPEE
jgi:hypothetical protein